MSNLILVTSNDVFSGVNLSGLITANTSSLIEITGDIPDSWFNFGVINIEANDQTIGNRYPIVYSTRLTNKGLLYIPDHNYNYQISFYPKPWLLQLDPKPVFNVYSLNIQGV